MAHAERMEGERPAVGRRTVAIAAAFLMWLVSASAIAAPSDSGPPHVQVMLVGDAQSDPTLFARIRSLFDPQTEIALHRADRLDSTAVLKSGNPDTVYLWITLQNRSGARVYASARESNSAAARYLFREVRLASGLDEVGDELLAHVAHSCAKALWAHEKQMPSPEIAAELNRDPARMGATAPAAAAAAAAPAPTAAPAPAAVAAPAAAPARAAATAAAAAAVATPATVGSPAAATAPASGGAGAALPVTVPAAAATGAAVEVSAPTLVDAASANQTGSARD